VKLKVIFLGPIVLFSVALIWLADSTGSKGNTRATAAHPTLPHQIPTSFTTQLTALRKQKLVASYGQLPLSFEANQGQTGPRVKFLSRGSGYTLYLTPSEAMLTLTRPVERATHRREPGVELGQGDTGMIEDSRLGRRDVESKSVPRTSQGASVLRLKLLGANPKPVLEGLDELPGKSNYFSGNDPKKWLTNMPTYARVKYRDIFPGVDLVYYGNQRHLEHDFIVAPGADPKTIALGIDAVVGNAKAASPTVSPSGDLVISMGDDEVRLQRPMIYQEINGVRREIGGGYVLKAENQVGFNVGAYDTTKPLVVDPTLVYSSFLGSISVFAYAYGVAVDSAGSAYVSVLGTTVNKLNAAGTVLIYSTFLNDAASTSPFIAVDSSGAAYVTGGAGSGLPTTPGAFQTALAAGASNNAFVTKLDPTGSALVYSTFLGGSGGDDGKGIAVDSSGEAYVAGVTGSVNFPTTMGAFLTALAGGPGSTNEFVTKLNSTGSALVYSTYLGGSDRDYARGIAVDSAGSAYVTGETHSTDFPTTPGAFQTSLPNTSGDSSAFVTVLNPAGTALVYSTYLGGSDPYGNADGGRGIAVDSSGFVYVVGHAGSSDFPTTAGAFQTTGPAAFVAKFDLGNTAPGANVAVQPVDGVSGTAPGTTPVSLMFSTITQGGNTTLTTSNTAAAVPAGFALGSPPTFYNLATTAVFSGSIQICINYTGVSFADPSQLHLFHFEGGSWRDVTTSLNTGTMTVCGSVTSLSPFAILQFVCPPPSLRVSLSPNTLWPPNHKLVPITASISFTEACPSPNVTLFSIVANEPIAPGDIQGAVLGRDDRSFALAASRSGSAGQRVYTVTYKLTDGAGYSTTANATVTVPHNQ